MKNIILFPLVVAISAGITGGATYAIRAMTDKRSKNSTSDVINNSNTIIADSTNSDDSENDDDENENLQEEVEEPGFTKLINKLMNTNQVYSSKSTISIDSLTSDKITLNLTNLDLDLQSLLASNISLDSVNLKCNIKVDYSYISESINTVVEDKMLYLNYDGKQFCFQIEDLISSLMDSLNSIGVSAPKVDSNPQSLTIDMNTVLTKGMALLDTIVESKTETGYEYFFDLNDFCSSLDLPLSNVKVILGTDNDYNLSYVKTVDNGIRINDNYNLKLNLEGLKLSSTSCYCKLNDDEKSQYVNITSSTSNIFSTIAKAVNKKSFNASLQISLKDNSSLIQNQKINADIVADLSTIKEDALKGTYQIDLEHKSNNIVANHLYGLYKDDNVYIKVNDLIKGKVSTSTINDLLKLLNKEDNSINTSGIMDEINTIIAGSDFDKLLSGDLSNYKGFLKSFNITESSISLDIDANYFNLGNFILTIEIEDTTLKDKDSINLKLKNVCYQNYVFDADIQIKVTDPKISLTDSDLLQFKDYSSIIPIFNTVSDLMDKKKFSSNYCLNVKTNSESYSAAGKLCADLSSLKTNDIDNYYGDYALTFDTNINNINHNIKLNYQDHDLYMKFDKFFSQSIKDTEIGKIKDVLNDNIESSGDAFDDVNKIIEDVKNNNNLKTDLFDKIKDSYSLKPLESFISIDKSNIDKDKLIVDLNLDNVLNNTTLKDKVSGITLEVDTNERAITSIQISNLKISELQIDFSLSLDEDLIPFSLTEEDKSHYVPVNDADKYLSGFFSLPIDLEKFNLTLDGSVKKEENNTESTLISLKGNASSDTTATPLVGGNLNLFEGDENPTCHHVDFKYEGDKTSGQTIAEYTTLDSSISDDKKSTMHILCGNRDVVDIFNQIKTIKDRDNNLLYPYLASYFDTATNVATGVPLMDLIQQKNYSHLLDDYIKKIEIANNKIYLSCASSLLDEDGKEDQCDSIEIAYSTDFKINKIKIDGHLKGYHINASISLDQYDNSVIPNMMEYNDSTKLNFVDFSGFTTLLSCLLTTTEHHYFDLSGKLTLDMKLGEWELSDFYSLINCRVLVVDQRVDVLLQFRSNEKQSNEEGFYTMEYYIKGDMAYTIRNRTVKEQTGTKWGFIPVYDNIQYLDFKRLEKDEILNNIVYYLLEYTMNISSFKALGIINIGKIILGNVYSNDQSMTATISKNYSGIIDKAYLTNNDDGSSTFDISLFLSKLIDVGSLITFDPDSKPATSGKLDVNSENELSSFELKTKIKAVSLIDVNVDLQITRDVSLSLNDPEFKTKEDSISKNRLQRYYDVINLYEADSELMNLDYYRITSIQSTGSGINMDISVTDNGQSITRKLSETNTKYAFSLN